MTDSAASRVPRVLLGDDGYSMSRLLVGGWQLSRGHRPGHDGGQLDEDTLFEALGRMTRAGMTTFDCADIYAGVEELFGRFRKSRHLARDTGLQVHTKLVPDEDALGSLTKADVERAIDGSLTRLDVERIDLVQLAWWDYDVSGYLDAALWLSELRSAGKIRHVGATNFDVVRMREMLDAGAPLVCNQVQYSLLDRRPEHGMAELARERGFALISYGALAGGFISERFVGKPDEEVELATRSLVKYRLIVDEAGGWSALQELLAALEEVARRHGVTIPAVALRWVLERNPAGGVLIGTYHGGHTKANLESLTFELDDADRARIDAALGTCRELTGDCFGLERVKDGPHARVLWTNLNRDST